MVGGWFHAVVVLTCFVVSWFTCLLGSCDFAGVVALVVCACDFEF